MFKDCKSLTSIVISNFNVSNIKNFDGMFSGCSKLISLDISNFNTKNAITMDDMFNGCNSLNKLDISNFDTTLITSFKKMFYECKSLTNLKIPEFKNKSISSLEYLFFGCTSLKQISSIRINSNSLTNIAHMFEGCSNLTSINFANFGTTKVKSMEYMFSGCSSLKSLKLNEFDTSSVKNMGHMFEKCTTLTTLDLTTFNTISVTNMGHMFRGCKNLRTIDLSKFDTHLTENMEYMFADNINLVHLKFDNFNESNIKNFNNMFQETLSNMIFCFNESTSPELSKIVENKGCAIVNCSDDAIKQRKKIIATTNQCVDECTGGFAFLYDYKCYYKCPKGTNPYNFICHDSSNSVIDSNNEEECNIKKYLKGDCKLLLYDYKQKRKFIDQTVNEMLRNDLYDIMSPVIDNKEYYVIREENEIYHIYSLKNKHRENDLTYIDFGECGVRLKEYYGITNEDDLLVFKIEYKSPDFRIPIIEYALFGVYGTKRLNLFICNGLKINYFIPITINNYEEYIYNPENKYYNDQCYPAVSNNIADLTLKERIGLFNEKNLSLCESMCTFKGYKYNNIICECRMKFKFNSFLNIKSNKYNLIYRIDEIESNNLNFWVCFIEQKNLYVF